MYSPTYDVLENLAQHLQDIDLSLYVGTDAGAHQPVYFVKPKNLVKYVDRSQRFMPLVRTTASLYSEPHRTMEHAELVWAIIADFDYDRFEMTGLDRHEQEMLLHARLQKLPPTFAVQTRNGFHLYWVLKEPEPVFSYAYTASILRDAIQSDPSTVVFTHCMTLYSLRKDKPGHIVTNLIFPALGRHCDINIKEFETYTLTDIQKAYKQAPSLVSEDFISAVAEFAVGTAFNNRNAKFQLTSERKELIDEIVESTDLVRFFRVHGYQAYSRGRGKIVMTCPYHLDRRPSAFVNVEPTSEFYGLFHCVSCGKKRSLPNMVADIESGKV